MQEPSTEARLEVINEYLTVEYVPVVGSLPNGDINDEHQVTRSISVESDDSANSKSARKTKQLQTVAKSFGSIGKSISKNLKKMGTLGKGEKKKSGNAVSVRNNGVNELDNQHILCAKLLSERLSYQDDIVHNYLQGAEKRFMNNQQQCTKVSSPPLQPQPVECINTGCTATATAATSYLCQACFCKQKQEELKRSGTTEHYTDGVRQASLGVMTDPMPVCAGVSGSGFQQHSAGKSKFYMPVGDQPQPPPPPPPYHCPPNNHQTNNMSVAAAAAAAAAARLDRPAVDLARSSFFDESMSAAFVDNRQRKEWSGVAQEIPATDIADTFSNQPTRSNAFKVKDNNLTWQWSADSKQTVSIHSNGGTQHKCKQQDCEFFGTANTDFYCSACYRKKHEALLKEAESKRHTKL